MPDPDPQPPQPRAVSPARWLLMLLPSVIMLAMLWCAHSPHFPGARYELPEWSAYLLLSSPVLAVALCFWFGFRLEKWQRGEIKSVVRAIGLGFLILFNNCCIFFAGCTVIIFPDLK